MSGLNISDESEFQRLMEQTDAQLKREDVPIPARQIQGWLQIGRRYTLELRWPMTGEKPQDGSYSGHDLSIRIFDWFDEQYGDRLNIDHSPGHTVVVIGDDLYRVFLPRIYGRVVFVADPKNHRKEHYPALATEAQSPTINVLDQIADLSRAISQKLSTLDRARLVRFTRDMTHKFQGIELLYKMPLGEQARGDFRVAIDSLFYQPPQFGNSRFSSLQAAEKCLKVYLANKGTSYPKGLDGHDLAKLSALIADHHKIRIPRQIIERAQCGAGVRYGDEPSTRDQAVDAHYAAVEIGWRIADRLR